VPAYNSSYSLTRLRLEDDCKYVFNGGYHLSYIGGVKSIKTKLASTSHTEISYQAEYSNEQILEGFKCNVDPFTREKLVYSYPRNGLFHNEFIDMVPEKMLSTKRSNSYLFWLIFVMNIVKHGVVITKKKLKYLL